MATNLSALEAAMVEATASRAPVQRKLTTTKAEYDAARAELDARARAGQTVMTRNRLGRFTGSVKVSTFGAAAALPAHAPRRKAVEAPAAAPKRDRHAPAQAPGFAISAEA